MRALFSILTLLACLPYHAATQCHAGFTYQVNEGSVSFYPADSSSGKTHYWVFGDGNTGNSVRETHHYAPGIYTVQHTLHDTVSNCTDAASVSINIDYKPACTSYFSVHSDHPDLNHVSFRQHAPGEAGIIKTTWKVDGITIASDDYGSDFEYIFAPSLQPHIIIMDVETVYGCVSTYSDTIHTYQKCDLGISFTYTASPYDSSAISFIPNNTSLSYAWFSDSYRIAGGVQGDQYRFPTPGNYAVTMRAIDSLTYCFDTVSQAISVGGNSYDSCTIGMNLSIEGNLLVLSPVSDQPITLQHWSIHSSSGIDSVKASNGDPQQYPLRDTGMHIISLFIETGAGCTKHITDFLVAPPSDNYSPRTAMTAYPNPANGEVTFTLMAEKENNATIIIFTAMGKTVLQLQKRLFKGKNHIAVPVLQLPRGQYFVHIQQGGRTSSTSFNKL